MSTSYSKERLVAELAVQRASILTKRVLSMVNKGLLSKTDSTPVTIADFAVQALLISAMHQAFPTDRFVGEEDSDALRRDEVLKQSVWELVYTTHLEDAQNEAVLASPKSMEEMLDIIDLGGRGTGGREGRVWVLDPVDGTATFLRGEQYAVALALVEDGEEKVGVLGCPNLSLDTGRVSEASTDKDGLGIMLSAVKGEGAVMRSIGKGSLLPGNGIERPKDNSMNLKDLHFVNSTTSTSLSIDKQRRVVEEVGASWPGTDLWSSQMRYVALIVGGGDFYLRIPLRKTQRSYVWDHAGGHLIFKEVGGKITDLDGKEIDFGAGRTMAENWGMVAANESIHPIMLEIVGRLVKEDSKE
jgi:3'(2'), 5'-bisphosphate nucleotidase